MQHLKHFFINHDPDLVVDKVARTAHGLSYLGAGGTVASGLTMNEWGVVVGMAFTALTYFTFLYFKVKQDQREERALQAKLKRDIRRS